MVPVSLLWLNDMVKNIVETVKIEGGIVLKNVIPPDRASTLAKYVLDTELNERKNTDAQKKSIRDKGHRISAKGIGSVSKFDSILPELAAYLSDDRIVRAAENLLGVNFRISTIGGLVNFPGNQRGYWHSDWPFNQTVASNVPAPYPDIVMHLSSLIMLTEFSSVTGGTLIVPKSHLIPNNPSGKMDVDANARHPNEINVTGNPGDVFFYDSRLWHAVAENKGDAPRVAISVRYAPWWLNLNVQQDGHRDRQRIVLDIDGKDSITPRISQYTYNKLPEKAKTLFTHLVEM
ncbi:MAG: phytanoyl-CoA dioxygenase [Chloroflexi bacterium]|nr:phytanoyl-CoA dioxygenase [Chloroflexota bacterium]